MGNCKEKRHNEKGCGIGDSEIEKRKCLKLLLNTNTLVSASITKGNEYELLRAAKLGKIKLIISPAILKEFIEVISREKFCFSKEQINAAFKQILTISLIVFPAVKIDVIKEDLQDNRVLECAEAASVDYIVSGDNHLLKLKKYKKISIVRTSEILNSFKNRNT
ncbi:putative toxin-antitoxin system toxin component, PIN family [Candidatus Woesearchaeota archaeon]|nr:putative toxin-antitoxin system toxin component, PIN family [Candidatus Woesearchaeota archaeon]